MPPVHSIVVFIFCFLAARGRSERDSIEAVPHRKNQEGDRASEIHPGK